MAFGAVQVFCFLAVLSIFNVSVMASGSHDEKLEQMRIACNGTKEDIETFKQHTIPSTESGKCLMLCFLTDHWKAFDSQGKYDAEIGSNSLLASFPHKAADISIVTKNCEMQLKDEPASSYKTCELGYKAMKCFNKELREHGFMNEGKN